MIRHERASLARAAARGVLRRSLRGRWPWPCGSLHRVSPEPCHASRVRSGRAKSRVEPAVLVDAQGVLEVTW